MYYGAQVRLSFKGHVIPLRPLLARVNSDKPAKRYRLLHLLTSRYFLVAHFWCLKWLAPYPNQWIGGSLVFSKNFFFNIRGLVILIKNSLGIQTDGVLSGRLQEDKIKIREDGKLVIKFKTQTKFRGLFVQEHRTLPTRVSLCCIFLGCSRLR